jgi:hypothetical protein
VNLSAGVVGCSLSRKKKINAEEQMIDNESTYKDYCRAIVLNKSKPDISGE